MDIYTPSGRAAPEKELSLFDSTCIIVGVIIGAGIYRMAPDIAKDVWCFYDPHSF